METITERTFVLGTRQSQLALWQANHVAARLTERFPDFQYRLEHFTTTGDRRLDVPLPEIGGKGLFTAELEAALHTKSIDLVVHSLKDLPVTDSAGLVVAAIPVREKACDVLIARQPWTIDTLPQGARVGTSSLRRGAQLLAYRPDFTLLPMRGNVDTRIRKAMQGEYDAIVLAAAGVMRLGLQDHVRQELPLEAMLPAPGQGALAVQCRKDDIPLRDLLAAIDHLETREAVTAERAFLEGLGGGCSAPVAAYAAVQGERLTLTGLVALVDGRSVIRVGGSREFTSGGGRLLGQELARQAIEQGAADLLAGRLAK